MLQAEGLRHAFDRVRALDGISFTLSAGQTLALFGPNGAGKTTLLKVLAGLIRPQQGRAVVEGGRRAVGWIGHQSHLYGHLTVRENLLFWGSLYDLPAAEFRRLLRELGGGRIVVLATHNVDEGVELATDVAFQARGRFVHFAPRAGRGGAEIAEAYRQAVAGA